MISGPSLNKVGKPWERRASRSRNRSRLARRCSRLFL